MHAVFPDSNGTCASCIGTAGVLYKHLRVHPLARAGGPYLIAGMNPTHPTPPAAAAGTATLLLYNYIDDYEARRLAEALQVLPPEVHTLHLRIHSPGGEVYSGFALYHLLRGLHARGVTVHTYIDGLAASMAGIVALAGARVHMAQNARFMLHRPWAALQGTSDVLRDNATELDSIAQQLVTIYAEKTGQPEAAVQALMQGETYLTADDALALGLVDALTDAVLQSDLQDAATGSAAQQAPAALYAAYTPRATAEPGQPVLNEALRMLRSQLAEAETALQALRAELAQKDAEDLVAAAVAEGRIARAQQAGFVALAQQAPHTTREVLAALPTRSAAPTLAARIQAAHGTDTRSTWRFRDWEKRDPAALHRMRSDDPARYERLYRAQYGTA